MYLERLEIQGFKSFANPVELVFNRELTAIVGPNGSGKSNIADAVRWVLGEQSVKTLRGKKAEDIIFAGSDKKNKLGYAEVSLFLNNTDRQADVDYEQIVVTRKIARDGESEYLINNNKVRLLDVQLLLAKANFGQKTYSVIGQGMIDSILTSSAQERKEFFDEATGVKQFQIKKNQSINKLDNAKQNLVESAKIMAELEPRLRSLTRQVKKLERREKMEAELKELQSDYYSFLHNNLDSELKYKRQSFEKLQKQVADLNQRLIEVQTQLDKEEKFSSRQENFESLRSKLNQTQSELNSFLKKKAILEGQADLKLMSVGQGDLVWLSKRAQDLANDINRDKIDLKEKEIKLKDRQADLNILEGKRSQILAEFESLEKKLQSFSHGLSPEELAKKIKTVFARQNDFKDILDRLTNWGDLPKLRKLCQEITRSLSELADKLKGSQDQDRNLWQKEFNKLLSSKDNLVAEISDARTKTALLESEVKSIEAHIKKSQAELNSLNFDKKMLLEKADLGGEIKNQLLEIKESIALKEEELKKIEEQIKSFNEEEEGKRKSLVEAQKNFRELQAQFNEQNALLNEVKVALARLETREEELNNEIKEEFPAWQIRSVEKIDAIKSKEEILRLKSHLAIIGGIDEEVIEEYKEVNERYNFLKEQSEDLSKAIGHLEKIIKDLEESISSQFDQVFKNINKSFGDYFKKLFNGGKAELTLDIQELKIAEAPVDENNGRESTELEEGEEPKTKKQYGIEIKAVPLGKKLSSINMLSGGEKALTSIALVCAIIANNPSPFVVLDEVDAALDEANSIRFSEILAELSTRTQFIAISHNRATMAQAKIIYGVTMDDNGVSRLLSVNFEEADEIAQ
ncbi:MAG: AAA family ATPase [bacterium]|nr:AAA family ATPase [bacterium]